MPQFVQNRRVTHRLAQVEKSAASRVAGGITGNPEVILNWQQQAWVLEKGRYESADFHEILMAMGDV
jgi:hypothetical protein